MLDEKISKVRDINFVQRDVIIDELCDLIEAKKVPREKEIFIVDELIQILDSDNNNAVIESILNLLALEFFNNVCSNKIANACARNIHKLDVGSLCHALPIIAESNLPNKKSLIADYIESDNSTIKQLAKEVITDL